MRFFGCTAVTDFSNTRTQSLATKQKSHKLQDFLHNSYFITTSKAPVAGNCTT